MLTSEALLDSLVVGGEDGMGKRSGPPLNQLSSGTGSPRILAASTSLR